jgi:hypothetical protein
MPTRVRFRFNKLTGEIEEFLVDDQDRQLPESEHDRIAAEVARMVAVSPGIAPVDDIEAERAAAAATGEPAHARADDESAESAENAEDAEIGRDTVKES